MADQGDNAKGNLRAAEAMLERSILERRKALAELALATLLEMAPNHPRRRDYEAWVAEIDREAKTQARYDQELARARGFVESRAWAKARQRLGALRKLDAVAAEAFAAELAAAEQAEANDASIEARRQRIEDLLAVGRADEAEAAIEALAGLGVTKLTLDFLRQRVGALRRGEQVRQEAEALEAAFERLLTERAWAAARDTAHRLTELGSPRAGAMFERLGQAEAEDRRRQSIAQGLATLEGFIAQGRRAEAQLALQVLRGLDLDPQQIQLFQQRVNRL